jgi:hypothetical protein
LTYLQYEFLAHALVGVAASHLNATSEVNLSAEAYSHRVHAIKGLNTALSQPPESSSDADALLATCYALACQSALMGDSIAEILTMWHGAQLVLAQHCLKKERTVFHSLSFSDQLEEASTRLQDTPLIDPAKVHAARKSLEQLLPLCNTPIQKRVLQGQLEIIYSLSISSRIGLP